MPSRQVLLVASGDLRQSANAMCWPAQAERERLVSAAVAAAGGEVRRAHPYRAELRHGFIAGQADEMAVFADLDPTAPVIVAGAVWQYSHHVLAGLISHRGPILTVANWSGTWPGRVGLLNLNGTLTKAGVRYSSPRSEDFSDAWFRRRLMEWLASGQVTHDASHVRAFDVAAAAARDDGAMAADASGDAWGHAGTR